MLAATIVAQQPATPAPPAVTSANPDGTITFRYRNAAAQQVTVDTEATSKPLTMQKGADGVWTATTPPLKPEHYGYTFRVDGTSMPDPQNHELRPNIVGLTSDILVPASPPAPWELTAVPHGAVARYVYTTHVAQGLPMNQEPYMVYTPPGYDPKHGGGYPVLYLLHGWSDNEAGWTAVGQANLILDTLLAQGKIVPMIVVMPMGYGDYSFVTSGGDVWNQPARVDTNVDLYSQVLLSEIEPVVERDYAIAPGREKHAIAGLSMGGLEAVTIGLKHPEVFSYVVGMSSALHQEAFDQHFPNYAAGTGNDQARFRLLWIGCGVEDHLIAPNRDFVAWAKKRNLPVTAVETPGRHTWLVWRDNLITVAPLLFR